MAISFNRYIRITSGVIGAGGTPTREFMARVFTTSALVPTNTIVEFSSADDVSNFFGSASEEAARATFYFAYISPSISSPRSISFARWANIDTGAQAYGARLTSTLTELQAVSAGGFTVSLAGVDGVVTGLDLSSAGDFAAVASALQTSIRSAGGTFANFEVTYEGTRQRFELSSGNTGAETITFTDGAQTPLALLGLTGSNVLLSDGVVAQTPQGVLAITTERSNNFGTFLFMPTLTPEQYLAAAQWNAARNVEFMFMVPVTESNASTLSTSLIGVAGCGLVLIDEDQAGQYDEMLPAAIFAATDYTAANSVQNYMFKRHGGLTAKVTTNAAADLYDPIRVNYYGQTQNAGQLINFFQRGVLCGGATAPVSMNTYANEVWLKDLIGSRLLNLLLTTGRVSANQEGRGSVLNVLAGTNSPIDEALTNGAIQVGSSLSQIKRVSVQQITNDPLAFSQVENFGYWLDATVEDFVADSGITESRIDYTLVYAKDDAIRQVTGRHALV